jgi:AcrR family transcriptional regulator
MSGRDPKQVILDAALSVFAEFGFEGATIGQILARAGVSNGALFHHFSSKEAIAEALYLRGIASYQAGLAEVLARHRGARAARAAVKAVVHHHLNWVETNRALARFMYERGRPDWQPAHGDAVRKLNRAALRHVHEWMTPLVRAGVIRDLPLTVLSAFINGPAHFIARRWLSGLITTRPTSFSELLGEAAWAAIAAHKPRPSRRLPLEASPAALLEAAALDAARANSSTAVAGHWTVSHLTMIGTSAAKAAPSDSVRIESITMEADGRVAVVELHLVDWEGKPTVRGSAVCVCRAGGASCPQSDVAEPGAA